MKGRLARLALLLLTSVAAPVAAAEPEGAALFPLGAQAAAEGRIIAAQDLMRRFLAESGGEVDAAAEREARRVLALPRGAAGEVSITGERGALVLVDERLVGRLPLSLPLLLEAGSHRVRIEKGGRRVEDQLQVAPGRPVQLRFKLSSGVLLITEMPLVIVLFSGEGRLGAAVVQAVRQANAVPVEREQALRAAPELAGCLGEDECQQRLAGRSGAHFVLTVQVGGGALQARLLDVGTADEAGRDRLECGGCGPERQAERAARLVHRLLEQGMTRPRGVVVVRTEPAGAAVSLAERRVGQAPLRRRLKVGAHAVRIEHRGYAPYLGSVQVEEGREVLLRVALVPLGGHPGAAAAAAGRPRWRLGLGVAALALGGGALGFGASALAIDSQCNPGAAAGGPCPYLYDTLGLGVSLTVSGAVLLAGGVALMAWPRPRGLDKEHL